VTDQAIDVTRIGEIESVVHVLVTGVAFGTALKVARNADAEVVQQILLANRANPAARQVDFPQPVPVRRSHHLLVPFGVARNANGCDVVRGSKLLLQDGELLVVYRRHVLARVRPFQILHLVRPARLAFERPDQQDRKYGARN
jgi:hypothetical protein